MEQALEGADAVHRVSEFTHYTSDEGGEVMPWTFGKIDGRALKKRDKVAVKINGVKVHGLGSAIGVGWDCVNGYRVAEFTDSLERIASPVDVTAAFARVDADNAAQAYALRIWDGQSIDVSIPERVERVVNGLRGQGMGIAVSLPHPDAERFLAKHA